MNILALFGLRRGPPLTDQLGLLAAKLSMTDAEHLGSGYGLKVDDPRAFVDALGSVALFQFFQAYNSMDFGQRVEVQVLFGRSLDACLGGGVPNRGARLRSFQGFVGELEKTLMNATGGERIEEQIGRWVLNEGKALGSVDASLPAIVGGMTMAIANALLIVATGR